MLRRWYTSGVVLPCSTAAVAMAAARFPAERRHYHLTSIARNTGNSKDNERTAAEEDREELERERRLRERFAEKIQEGLPQQNVYGSNMGGPGWGGAGTGGPFPVQPPLNPDMAKRAFNFFFYLTAFLFLMAMAPLADRNSPMYTMQGLPWWELPISSAAYFLLLRALYSRAEQNRIKTEFENAARANPMLTFDQFMSQQYPTMFQGYRTSQAEVVAAVAACLSAAKDLRFAQSMVRAAGRAKDPRASTDDVVDALRRDFPHLF